MCVLECRESTAEEGSQQGLVLRLPIHRRSPTVCFQTFNPCSISMCLTRWVSSPPIRSAFASTPFLVSLHPTENQKTDHGQKAFSIMNLRFRSLGPLFLFLPSQVLAQNTPEARTEPWIQDPAIYANAFIGTVSVRHVFPGTFNLCPHRSFLSKDFT
jgi:hypothetical protein